MHYASVGVELAIILRAEDRFEEQVSSHWSNRRFRNSVRSWRLFASVACFELQGQMWCFLVLRRRRAAMSFPRIHGAGIGIIDCGPARILVVDLAGNARIFNDSEYRLSVRSPSK